MRPEAHAYENQLTTTEFTSQAQDYERRGQGKTIASTVWQLRLKPFGNRALETHRVDGVRGNLPVYTSKVTASRRIIWTEYDRNTQVLLLVGEHDKVYRSIEGRRIDKVDHGAIAIKWDDVPRRVVYRPGPGRESRLFDFADDQMLRDHGISDHAIPMLREVQTLDSIVDLVRVLHPDQLSRAWSLLESSGATDGRPNPFDAEQPTPVSTPPPAPVPEPEREREPAVPTPEIRIDVEHLQSLPAVNEEALRDWLAKPIEDWMTFLDPAQRYLVSRPFSGPARVSGPAGTGKTVVGLHRAVHVLNADPAARILVTTLVSNLPKVLASLVRRMTGTTSDRADFMSVHAWSLRYLRDSQLRVSYDQHKADALLRRSIARHGRQLRAAGLSTQYLVDEIRWVIRGRGLADEEEYLALSRTGRGSPLRTEQRGQVWAIHEDYCRALLKAGFVDADDLIRLAAQLVEKQGVASRYDLVVVDEAQDLTLIGARLLGAIARSTGAQLLVLGDGHQSIYPGSFRLIEAGIDVRGRARVLTRNYRNAADILQAADAVGRSGPHEAAELDTGEQEVVPDVARVDRGRLLLEACGGQDDLHLAAAVEVERVVKDGANPGDIAVLVPSNKAVAEWTKIISELGFPTMKLGDYRGVPSHHVKVGTYHRAKGLEFKHVLLPGLDSKTLGDARRTDEDEADHRERRALTARQLFVAMTRARDSLWMAWVGTPSDLITPLARP